jgi:two-component system NarL family sensor kinase
MENEVITFSGICLCLLFTVFIIYFIFFYRKKQVENEQEKKGLQLKYERGLLQSQIEIQEQLLQQVSTEIHDNLGQVAALIKINLATFPRNIPPDAMDKLEQTRELMKKLTTDLKALSVSLNTDYLEDEGLLKVLEREVEKLNRTGTIHAVFYPVGYLPEMEVGKEIFLYRMVQELIGNVLKHAQAKELVLSVDANEHELAIQVKDNGTGFDPAFLENNGYKTSTGLRSLKKRCKLIGAILSIESKPGNGTSVRIHLPLTKKI